MKYSILFLFIVFTFLESSAQNPNPFSSFQNLVNATPLSPQAASLGKFGNIPVSPFTGIPSVSIPICEIAVAGIKLPISLDYHAGGVRVDEISSSVGIGWALNGVGIISRNVVGIPDQFGNPDPDAVAFHPGDYVRYVYQVKDGSKDSEPDIFQYNVNGLSGKFIFRNDGSIMQVPVTNNKIVYVSGGNFNITDPSGNVYIFEEKRSQRSSETSDVMGVTTWGITQMIAATQADTITFTYEEGQYESYHRQVSYAQSFGNVLVAKSTNCLDGSSAEEVSTDGGLGPRSRIKNITTEEFYPKEIKWRGGKVVFGNAPDRTDGNGPSMRLNVVEVYSDHSKEYNLVSRTKLYQSYFYTPPEGNGTATSANYRLRLDSVGNQDTHTGKPVQVYSMKYNTTPIAPVGSFAQDRWGFNNGKNNNSTLMPTQSIIYRGAYVSFGDADRETNASQILACSLSSIQYPTKGRTDFEFEPHAYNATIPPKLVVRSSYYELCCSTNSHLLTNFTVPDNRKNYRYQVKFSRFDYQGVTDRPRIKMKDRATGEEFITESNLLISQSYESGIIPLDLLIGHTYDIDINIYTTHPDVKASLIISWEEMTTESNELKPGGGLRVKSIKNYDIGGKFIGKEVYQYGNGGAGYGTVLTPQYYQDINYETVVHRLGYSPCGMGLKYVTEKDLFPSPGYTTIYHANSVLPTSQYSGSPVVYREVTKLQVDSLGNANGKTVYTYGVYEDGASAPFEPITGILTNYVPKAGMSLISNTWKNGNLLFEEVYKKAPAGSDFKLISSTENKYLLEYEDSRKTLKIQEKYIHNGPYLENVADFLFSVLTIETGAWQLTSTTRITKDEAGLEMTNLQKFSYGTTPLLPSGIENSSSIGETLTESFKYPLDLAASGNVYQKMVDRNILLPVVQHQTKRAGSSVKQVNINYKDWFGDSKLLLPQNVDEQVSSHPSEQRIQFEAFDSYGNLLQQRKTNDVVSTYIWGYNHLYPVAEIKNATYEEVVAVLGRSTINALNDLPGTDAQVRQKLQMLRTSPSLKKALITTFTYAPLIGMTSATDTNGITINYEYDTFNRLMFIRDNNQNIMKRYEYNYRIR